MRDADAAIGAGQARGVKGLVSVDHGDQDEAPAELHGESDGHFQAMLDAGLHQQSVDDDLDGVVLALVETKVVFEIDQFAIDAGAGEAVLDELFHLFFELAFAAANDGGHDHDAVFGAKREDALHDLVGRLAGDGLAAIGAVGNADGGIEQAQVVVDFGDGADGGAGTAAGGFLLNGDGGAEAVDGVDVGALHLVEELARVGGESFDVAALTFGVDGVESKGRLARTTQSGNHSQGVAGDLDVDVLQVVLARPAHRNLCNGHLTR